MVSHNLFWISASPKDKIRLFFTTRPVLNLFYSGDFYVYWYYTISCFIIVKKKHRFPNFFWYAPMSRSYTFYRKWERRNVKVIGIDLSIFVNKVMANIMEILNGNAVGTK